MRFQVVGPQDHNRAVGFGRRSLHFEDEIVARAKVPSLNVDRKAFLLEDIADPFGPGLVGRRIAYKEVRHVLIHIVGLRLGAEALFKYQFHPLSIKPLTRTNSTERLTANLAGRRPCGPTANKSVGRCRRRRRLCPSSIRKPAPALPFGKNKTTNRCISLHRKFPRPPLRINVRKGSAPKVAGFYSATQPQNAAAPWPNIPPPHTASSRRTIF